jgi:hypothetical protein
LNRHFTQKFPNDKKREGEEVERLEA